MTIAIGCSANQCVWANKEITGLWNRVFWNEVLTNKISFMIHISDFLDSEGSYSLFYMGTAVQN